MKFGVVVPGDPATVADEAQLLESLGVGTLWLPDVPLVGYGDPFVAMTLALRETVSLRVGTFISPLGVRPAPIALGHFGTANQFSPGRVRMGVGSGSFSRAIMGIEPLRVAEIRRELLELRSLMDHGVGEVSGLHFARWDRQSVNLGDALPLEVAAHGIRGARLAGEFGDGLLTAGEIRPHTLAKLYADASEAARAVGRSTSDFGFVAEVGPLCVVRPGETLSSRRIIEVVQPIITGHFIFFFMAGTDPDQLDSDVRADYARFQRWAIDKYDASSRHHLLSMCDHYLGRDPEMDQFITPNVIEAHTLTASPKGIADRLVDIRRAGVTEVAVLRPLDRPYEAGRDVTELVSVLERVA